MFGGSGWGWGRGAAAPRLPPARGLGGFAGAGAGGRGGGAQRHAVGLQAAFAPAREEELIAALSDFRGSAQTDGTIELPEEWTGVRLRAKRENWCAGPSVAPLVGERVVQLHALCDGLQALNASRSGVVRVSYSPPEGAPVVVTTAGITPAQA
eukprot:gene10699-21265_t